MAPSGDLPGNAFHCRNDGGEHGFMGAAPPQGDQVHRYFFVVHAVGEPSLGVDSDTSPAVASGTLLGNTLGRAIVQGTYQLKAGTRYVIEVSGTMKSVNTDGGYGHGYDALYCFGNCLRRPPGISPEDTLRPVSDGDRSRPMASAAARSHSRWLACFASIAAFVSHAPETSTTVVGVTSLPSGSTPSMGSQ